jgi:hypothetical protein
VEEQDKIDKVRRKKELLISKKKQDKAGKVRMGGERYD